jgi:microcystin-dependent protein
MTSSQGDKQTRLTYALPEMRGSELAHHTKHASEAKLKQMQLHEESRKQQSHAHIFHAHVSKQSNTALHPRIMHACQSWCKRTKLVTRLKHSLRMYISMACINCFPTSMLALGALIDSCHGSPEHGITARSRPPRLRLQRDAHAGHHH